MSDDAEFEERPRAAVLRSDTTAAFDRWETPQFEADSRHNQLSPGVSIAQLEALQKQAYDEAYAQGLLDGAAEGTARAQAQGERLDGLLEQLARPFRELDECVEKQLVQLAMIVARNVIRRELKTDPSHVIGAVREALKVLPVAARDVRVKLHPEDAALVRKFLKPVEGERAWNIEEDQLVTRGGCRVETEFSHVDASIESRLSALLAAMVGDERAGTDNSHSVEAPS